MKNILNETPQKRLTGRLLASTLFCSQSDINKKNSSKHWLRLWLVRTFRSHLWSKKDYRDGDIR